MTDKTITTRAQRIAAARADLAASKAANPDGVTRYESRQAALTTAAKRVRRTKGDWCILLTSGAKTLPLARSLKAAGFDVWTPIRTFQRPKPGRRHIQNGRPQMVEIDAPILPTFVFAPGRHALALLAAANDPARRFPNFSVVHDHRGVPLVGERDVAGLRAAEREAVEMIEKIRAAATAEEARRLRAEAMRTARERKKALRRERRDLVLGQQVSVTHAPSLVGMSGVIQSTDGTSAVISFGGFLTMQVEAWQIIPAEVQAHAA